MNVAIVAPGEMGSAIGRSLAAQGARISTSLSGRSEASAQRAKEAGFTILPEDGELVAQADFVLSVVPPGAAIALAERLAPALKKAARKAVYVDCNAVAPRTVRRVAQIIGPTGCKFVDVALFGGPTSGKPGVVMYASGTFASELSRLAGVTVKVMSGPAGAASAFKLSFAGLNKGFTAVGAVMALAALRSGAQAQLLEQLADAQPAILEYIRRFVPAMFPKAYRWEPEMREIAAFLEDDEAAREMFAAMAKLYRRFAAGGEEIAALERFCRGR